MVQIVSTLLTASVALLFQVGRVLSADLASCNSSAGFDWSFNSLGQDPCTVATFLGGACSGGEFQIPAITSTEFYSGPNSTAQTACRCSTVFYALLMACGECQEASTTTWTGYSADCPTVYNKVFPESIPAGTVVPHWAYLDVVTPNQFNATAAQLAGDSPESSAAATATSSSTPSSPVSSSSSTPTSAGRSSKKDTGAIAGGVVGGVVGIALISAALFWFLRKRGQNKSSASVSAPFDNDLRMSPEMTGTTNAPSMAYPPLQQKLYDPSDPSTYPPNMVSPTTTHYPQGSINDHSVYNHSNPSTGPPQQMYSGYAEV
ncbi:hypothetical protein BT96DRAFT_376180 [Gymnopus androsaceus JB14]|uniref:Uncharacterized protein n=1 Tax=Gymnopus androsaceus JB14 TaxID=1447944 RepID=A0A6A4IKJ3_9AGAR|nr:hypothetical protein BT96DRAFT_376180 [Gymnopus androsaceus JB14]